MLATTALCLVASPQHVMPGHPESPKRLDTLAAWLGRGGKGNVRWIDPRPIAPEALALVHPSTYLSALQAAGRDGPGYIDPAPTYVTPASYASARMAAGGTLAVLEAMLDGEANAGFAVVRPPGHHATPDRAMGFCLMNNLALAARQAQARGLPRVVIFDFDVHHGNGTQAGFESDPDVLYISTHQEGIYPLTGWGEETGKGAGEGTVINIPLPGGTGDAGLLGIADQILAPAAERFRPDILLVSAGFDAHWRDPLAGLQVTTAGYLALAQRLKQLADNLCAGRVLFALEGGYDEEVLAEGVLACLAAFGEDADSPDELGPAPYPEPDIRDRIDRARSLHSL